MSSSWLLADTAQGPPGGLSTDARSTGTCADPYAHARMPTHGADGHKRSRDAGHIWLEP
jgi:hypothetical protein